MALVQGTFITPSNTRLAGTLSNLSTQAIANGGFGAIFTATWAQGGTNMVVAVKRVLPEHQANAATHIIREAGIWGRLQHGNIVPLIAYCTDSTPSLVMPYYARGSFQTALNSRPSLHRRVKLQLVRQTAEALEYLHRCGVIHCDIKPANVLIDNTWTARLSNFGLSTFALATMDMADLEKRANLGTEGFKAPEILFSGEATRQTDVFAFSCFIAAVFCSVTPFQNVSAPQAVMKLWRSNPLLPDEFKYIPSDLRELCTRCLSLYPEQRPAMAEVVAVLSVAQLP